MSIAITSGPLAGSIAVMNQIGTIEEGTLNTTKVQKLSRWLKRTMDEVACYRRLERRGWGEWLSGISGECLSGVSMGAKP